MHACVRYPFALALSFIPILLVGCSESKPLQPELCTPAAIGPPLTTSIGLTSLRSVLDDAASRVAPSLATGAGGAALVEEIQAVTASVAAGDRDHACRAYNNAVSAVNSFADGALDRHRPDLGAIRLALGLARVWLAGGS